jgi:hypothetical protein
MVWTLLQMTRDEILLKMRTKEPDMLWHTMALGGSTKQLLKMEAEGLISSQRRYSRTRHPQRDWYMTAAQYAEVTLTFMLLGSTK